MNKRDTLPDTIPASPAVPGGLLQRKCAGCGNHTVAGGGCSECEKKKSVLHRKAATSEDVNEIPQSVHQVLRSSGQALDDATRAYMEPRFGHDFSGVRVHADARAAESARDVHAHAYTVGRDVVFGAGRFAPRTSAGRELLAHELTHVVQQGGQDHHGSVRGIASESSSAERNADSTAAAVISGATANAVSAPANVIHRRAEPYIKKITVHLTPPQTAHLEWQGTAPSTPGSDDFTVSTGKGYSDPGDDPGTCTRTCCRDADTQCAPPWNRPDRVGACCTYYGSNFWTGTPEYQHNGGWMYWTPIQPWYSSRAIALHQHTEVTGQPIGHGCVRMDEENAQRIYEYSNGRRTNVTIDGRAAPVQCEPSQQCPGSRGGGVGGGRGASLETTDDTQLAAAEEQPAVPGLEGEMS
ncbi:MAG TPA: DUF4157 domain-containing protein [Pyrinomonadaceae bacterium]|nr:DUF4157 domain-containing protein [Pyrinomonadaceae bacterium]